MTTCDQCNELIDGIHGLCDWCKQFEDEPENECKECGEPTLTASFCSTECRINWEDQKDGAGISY